MSKVWERCKTPHTPRSFNPNGIVSSSPGLRAASYPGKPNRKANNPERVVSVLCAAEFLRLNDSRERRGVRLSSAAFSFSAMTSSLFQIAAI